MNLYILAIENDAGSICPLEAYDNEFDAADARVKRLRIPEVEQAMKLLDARYVVVSVDYRGKAIMAPVVDDART
jgi:hypothetical protein